MCQIMCALQPSQPIETTTITTNNEAETKVRSSLVSDVRNLYKNT